MCIIARVVSLFFAHILYLWSDGADACLIILVFPTNFCRDFPSFFCLEFSSLFLLGIFLSFSAWNFLFMNRIYIQIATTKKEYISRFLEVSFLLFSRDIFLQRIVFLQSKLIRFAIPHSSIGCDKIKLAGTRVSLSKERSTR